MEIKFEVVGEIKCKQRPRMTTINGYARAFPAKETVMYENYIRTEYERQCKDHYFGYVPLTIKVEAYFEPPQELKEHMEYLSKFHDVENKIICTKHKDFDNIYKVVCDSLNGIAYEDDKQIWYDEGFKKYYTLGRERLVITISNEIPLDHRTPTQIKEIYLEHKKYYRNKERYERLVKKSETQKLTKKELETLNELKLSLFRPVIDEKIFREA